MKKILREVEEKILTELEDVPDAELPKILEIIKYIKIGSRATENGPASKFEIEDIKGDKHKDLDHHKSSPTRYFNIQETAE